MQIADQTVAEGAQRLMMPVPDRSSASVVRPAPRTRSKRAERPHVGRVVEAPVPHEAGGHRPPAPRCSGERRGARVVSARLRGHAAFGVVPELAQHPGAEHGAQSRHRKVDRGVRMLLNSRRQLRLQRRELAVDLLELGDLHARAVGERLAHRGRGLKRADAERGPDLRSPPLHVARAAAAVQCGAELRHGEPRRRSRLRGDGEHRACIGVREVGEGAERGRNPAPRSVATHGPRSVSMPTTTSLGSCACSARTHAGRSCPPGPRAAASLRGSRPARS